jgi:ribosome-binding factor A
MTSHRPLQIAGVIRQVVARFASQIPPSLAQVVTVVDVRLSEDFSYADIGLTAISGVEEATKYLPKKKGEMRSELAAKLRVHRIPQLRFSVDEDSLRGNRIDEIFHVIDEQAVEKEKGTSM